MKKTPLFIGAIIVVGVFFISPFIANAYTDQVTISQVNSDTFCFLSTPASFVNNHLTIVGAGTITPPPAPGFSGSDYAGGPTHTCLNGYNYDLGTIIGGTPGTILIVEIDDTNNNNVWNTGENAVFAAISWDGTTGVIIPPPDGNTTTHIIDISRPTLFATTTSPVVVDFGYYQSSTSPTYATGYELDFVNTRTYQSKKIKGVLTQTYTVDGVYTQSTTTPLTGDGTWKLTVSLIDWDSSVPNYPVTYIDRSETIWFGLNFNDNVSTITLDAAFGTYASSSCQVNFLGSFSLSDCMGYLFVPSNNLFVIYETIPQTFSTRFPFSYFYSTAATWQSLNASTTENAPELEWELGDLGIGSTSPMGNILPNVTVFSASTTEEYFPDGTFELLKTLASIALILGLFTDIFFTTRNLIKV